MRLLTLLGALALATFVAAPAQANGMNPLMLVSMGMHVLPQMMHMQQRPQYGYQRPVYQAPVYRPRMMPRVYNRPIIERRPMIEQRRIVRTRPYGYGYRSGGYGAYGGYGGYGAYGGGTEIERSNAGRTWYHHEERRSLAVAPSRQIGISSGCGCNCCCSPEVNAIEPSDPPGDSIVESPSGSNQDNVPANWRRVQ